MSSSAASTRSLALSMRILQTLQSNGLQWMKKVNNRDQVAQAMLYYMTRLGIDASALPPVIHIAGTKGKGSTAAFTESILRNSGLRTGLYTSPHLVHVTERFRIDGKPVQEDTYLHHFWRAWDILNDGHTFGNSPQLQSILSDLGELPRASQSPISDREELDSIFHPIPALPGFNYLCLLAFEMFKSVDVIILEVGLGGRLDATNVLPASVVAVSGITTLDYDHTDLLGPTLAHIAFEKAGIIRGGVPAVTVSQRHEALAVIQTVAREKGVPLFLATPDALKNRYQRFHSPVEGQTSRITPQLGLKGAFQDTNAALAVSLSEIFLHRLRSGDLNKDRFSQENVIKRALGGDASSDDAGKSDVKNRTNLYFGSSSNPWNYLSPSDTTAPIAVYDRDSALEDSVLRGLRKAKWPGRAQIIDFAKKTGSSTKTKENEPIRKLFLDGAHTEQSILEAIGWYIAASGARIRPELVPNSGTSEHPSTSISSKDTHVLVFNCSYEKDSLSLLLPLSCIDFQLTFSAPVAWAITPRSPPMSSARALESYVQKKREMQDFETVKELEEFDRFSPKSVDTAEASPDSTASTTKNEWQEGLMAIWRELHENPRYLRTRTRLAAKIAKIAENNQEISVSSQEKCGHSESGITHLEKSQPSKAPPSLVSPSIAAVLKALDAFCASDSFKESYSPAKGAEVPSILPSSLNGMAADSNVFAFVTGSLYLVGGVLENTMNLQSDDTSSDADSEALQ